ncbi:MAG: DUF1365 domain-containing protein [Aestuariivita sp.]|nr:DUF1365 domain-containing protein [Aestuariivita sp.]
MMADIYHVEGHTWHGRKGAVSNAFRYSIDYVLMDAEAPLTFPFLFRRNRLGLCALFDVDYGGLPGKGSGAAWVRSVFHRFQLPEPDRILLFGQPRFWNHVFNPVSFWFCLNAEDDLTSVIAEVTNTFGERHSYLCRHTDGRTILSHDRLSAKKIHYVSPFQKVEGDYEFRFDVREDRVGVWIDYSDNGTGGVFATLTGRAQKMTNRSILRALIRRPFGSRRVLALIHWQALRLWWKGERYRTRPGLPSSDVTRGH